MLGYSKAEKFQKETLSRIAFGLDSLGEKTNKINDVLVTAEISKNILAQLEKLTVATENLGSVLSRPKNNMIVTEDGKLYNLNNLSEVEFSVSYEAHVKTKAPHEVVFLLKGDGRKTIDTYRFNIEDVRKQVKQYIIDQINANPLEEYDEDQIEALEFLGINKPS